MRLEKNAVTKSRIETMARIVFIRAFYSVN